MASVHRAGAISTVTLSALAITVGLAQAIAPRWVKQVGLDIWNLPSLRNASRTAGDETNELELQQEQLTRSIEAAEHVAARLAGGTTTLAQATGELEPLMRVRSGFDHIYARCYHVNTFRQGVARYTINHVERLLADYPSRWAAVSPRLEAEFAAIR